MARKPLVFISHSSLNDPDAGADLKAIVKRLETTGKVGVLLDQKRLKPGDPWRDYLHTWMAHCDSAIILLTPKALESAWVLKEATILSWRRSLSKDGDFILVPVLLGTDRRTVEANKEFGPLALFDLQPVKDLRGLALAKRLEAVLQPIVERSRPTPRQHLEEVLTEHLKVKRPLLDRVAAKLGADFLEWQPKREPDQRVAMLLLNAPFAKAMEAVLELNKAISKESMSTLIGLLIGNWVAPESAARFLRFASAPAGRRAIAVNGCKPKFTPRSIALRASEGPAHWTPIVTSDVTGDDLLSGLIRQIREALLQRVENDPTLIPDFVAEIVRTTPLVVVLPHIEPLPEDAVIDGLLKEYPELTIVIMTGTGMPPDGRFARATRLDPKLEEHQETTALIKYLKAREIAELPREDSA